VTATEICTGAEALEVGPKTPFRDHSELSVRTLLYLNQIAFGPAGPGHLYLYGFGRISGLKSYNMNGLAFGPVGQSLELSRGEGY
jgi:hypothetical protein